MRYRGDIKLHTPCEEVGRARGGRECGRQYGGRTFLVSFWASNIPSYKVNVEVERVGN